ncbi:MAG TPA: glycerol-3-phosphate 1-O-acyltransferase PlsY [Gaiellaceae bacterium]|nr:glycerol-3-phosphate 1-O-acyltransferase PlsY [Gaiellaceae bacterium]
MTAALTVAGAYLAGSMPFGYWLVRLLHGEDIRDHGSGNIGATNVWRVYGWTHGLPIVLLDVAKGFVPALLGAQLVSPLVGVLAGAAAMLGHWRPAFLGFAKGGKTVATGAGAFLAVAPLVALAGLAVWAVAFLATRYVSVGSMTAAVAMPFLALLLDAPWPVVVFAAAAGVAVLLLHRPNLARLRAGTENRASLRRRRRRRGAASSSG